MDLLTFIKQYPEEAAFRSFFHDLLMDFNNYSTCCYSCTDFVVNTCGYVCSSYPCSNVKNFKDVPSVDKFGTHRVFRFLDQVIFFSYGRAYSI